MGEERRKLGIRQPSQPQQPIQQESSHEQDPAQSLQGPLEEGDEVREVVGEGGGVAGGDSSNSIGRGGRDDRDFYTLLYSNARSIVNKCEELLAVSCVDLCQGGAPGSQAKHGGIG